MLNEEIIDISGDAIITLRAIRTVTGEIVDFRIVQCNKSAQRLAGLDDHSVGRNVLQLIPEISSSNYFDMLRRVVDSGEPFFAEVPFRRPGEEEEWFLVSLTKWDDGVVANLANISPFKRLSNRLAKQATLLEAILENLPSALIVYDAIRDRRGAIVDFKVRHANSKVFEYAGFTREELFEYDFVELCRRHNAPIYLQQYSAVVETGIPFDFEYYSVSRDRWFQFSVVKFEDGIIVKFNDVTERKRHELVLAQKNNLLESMLNSALVGFVVMRALRDETGRIVDLVYEQINERALQFRKREQVVSRTYLDQFPDARELGFWEKIVQVLETGTPLEYEQYYKGGDLEGWFDVAIVRLDTDRILVNTHDITPLKTLQQRLLGSIEGLRQSNERLSEFAHVASHDLKEPLRKILTHVSILHQQQHGDLPANYARRIERIEQAARRMHALIGDLLAYAEIDRVPKRDERVDLNELVQTILIDLESTIQETKAQLDIGPLPAVLGNRTQLEQAFQNLLSNAVKFHKPGVDPQVIIRATIVEEYEHGVPRKFHCISIADNGIGFDTSYSEQIFQIFQRLHSQEVYEGTGIGLAIVKRVMEQHRGFVRASSREGDGANFSLYFPT